MQIEFEYLPKPMPMDDSVLDFLLEKGMYFFCIVRESRQEYNRKTWGYDTITTDRVDTVIAHKNVTIWGHDMFRPDKNKELLAYCKLEFPEGITVHI